MLHVHVLHARTYQSTVFPGTPRDPVFPGMPASPFIPGEPYTVHMKKNGHEVSYAMTTAWNHSVVICTHKNTIL